MPSVNYMMNATLHKSFEVYRDLLLKWNAKTNLTAITAIAEIDEKHLLDSLSVLPYLKLPWRTLDLGTGAGFPGIPLKIMLPELELVLVDAKQKKVSFLQAVIAELALENVQACAGRAEDTVFQEKMGKFDLVLSRATWDLKDFLPIAVNYLKKDGKIIAMKGPRWESELEAAKSSMAQYQLNCQKIEHYQLPSGAKHSLLFFSRETAVLS